MKTPNSPSLINDRADRYLKKLALLIAFLPPLADTVVLFPLTQIALANGLSVLYQILSVASQLVSLSGFFASLALAVYCVFTDALGALGRVIALQGISYLCSVVLLRTLMQWLLALIDSTLQPIFALSNYMLSTLTDDDGLLLIWSAISLFLNVLMLMALLLIVVGIALLFRRKLKKRPTLEAFTDPNDSELLPRLTLCLRIATLIYLVQALANQVYTTVSTAGGWDTAQLIANLATIIAPYFLLAIYAFVGYWVMQWTVRRIACRIRTLASSER